jgi:hypothetical protein
MCGYTLTLKLQTFVAAGSMGGSNEMWMSQGKDGLRRSLGKGGAAAPSRSTHGTSGGGKALQSSCRFIERASSVINIPNDGSALPG